MNIWLICYTFSALTWGTLGVILARRAEPKGLLSFIRFPISTAVRSWKYNMREMPVAGRGLIDPPTFNEMYEMTWTLVSMPFSMAFNTLAMIAAAIHYRGELRERIGVGRVTEVSDLERVRSRRSELRTFREDLRSKDRTFAEEDEQLAQREAELVSSEGTNVYRTRAIEQPAPPLQELPREDTQTRAKKTAS